MRDDTDTAFAVTYPMRRVLIFSDTGAARITAVDAVERTGAQVVDTFAITDGADDIVRQRDAALVFVEVAEPMADTQPLEALLDRLDRDAAAGRRSVVRIPLALLDLAAARAGHRGVAILCDPSPVERVAALSEALVPPASRLNDISADPEVARLRQLTEEVARIARTLAGMSAANGGRSGRRDAPLMDDIADEGGMPRTAAIEASLIRTVIRARRLRNQYFNGELFADPAWDILLDLIAARLERSPVAVSSLCIAAAVPPTTGLRWIKTLTDAGLLVRTADARDGRRIFIELSETAANGMLAYLNAAARLGTMPI